MNKTTAPLTTASSSTAGRAARLLLPSAVFRLADRITPAALRLDGYRSTWVRTTAGRMHVLEVDGYGTLPPFLMLHGLGSSASDYAPLARGLRAITRKLILPDMPGHGLSESPPSGMVPSQMRIAVREALDARVSEPCFVFGNSLGGLAAVRFAQMRPERVLGLFLASPGGAPMSPEELASLLAGFDLPSHTSAMGFVDRLLGAPMAGQTLLALGVRARMRRPPIQDLLRRISTDDLLTHEEVGALTMPICCFWGQQDDVLPPHSREFFRTALPEHAEFEDPPGFGHAPFLDQPEAFLRRVEQFANRALANQALANQAPPVVRRAG